MARLTRNVHVADEWWGPAYGRVHPPAEVAEQITNPACWSDDEPAADPAPQPDPAPEPALEGMDRDALLAVADAEGIDVDRRWGAKRLAAAIREARADR